MIRRGLAFAAAFLFVAGLEMSTEAISLVLARLRAGVGALMAGAEFHVSPLRFVVGVLTLVVGLAIGILLLWSRSQRVEVASVGALCPQCGNRTRRVKRRDWQRLLGTLLGEPLTRRQCETCGWTGLSLG